MSEIRSSILDPRSSVPAVPVPRTAVAVRPAVAADLAFIDALQKRHAKAVGWMPAQQLAGKVAAGQVLVAEGSVGEGESGRRGEGETRNGAGAAVFPPVSPSPDLPVSRSSAPEPIGYVIASDRYLKHDDVGIIYQVNVVPGAQRGLVGAALVRAVFDRAAYGCKLFCCWCAQDLEANRFWEALGFVPLAFRAGSARKARVHIFWQRRVRAGDTSTPWWFPAQTNSGAIREDRLVLPIPPGTHWGDAKPIVLPGGESLEFGVQSSGSQKRLEGRGQRSGKKAAAVAVPVVAKPQPASRRLGGWGFAAPPPAPVAPEPVKAAKAERPPRPRAKNDPKLVAAARELRDRWLERVNGEGLPLPAAGKYDVGRLIEGHRTAAAIVVEAAGPTPLLADARAA